MTMTVICVAQMNETRGRYIVQGPLPEVREKIRDAVLNDAGFVTLNYADDGSRFVLNTAQIESFAEIPQVPGVVG